MESILQDLRHAVRSLRRAPLFALASIAIVAIGAGAAGGMFGVVHHLLLTPFALPGGERVVFIEDHRDRRGESQGEVSTARFLAYREATGLDRLEAYQQRRTIVRTHDGSTNAEAALVTPGLFSTLGIRMRAGRAFVESDGSPSAAATALVSERLARVRWGGSAAAVGQTLTLDGVETQVIGVVPVEFELPAGNDVWRPWSPLGAEREDREHRDLVPVGRLRAGVSAAALQAELAGIAQTESRRNPATDAGLTARVVSLRDGVLDEYAPTFESLTIVALLLMLLVVAANLAGLQLARGVARQREWAVRAALGASTARLAQQSLIESLVLSTVGGVLGLGIAALTVRGVLAAIPVTVTKYVPGWSAVGMDAGVVAYALGLSAVTGIAFGLGPAIQAARQTDAQVLRSASGTLGSVRSRSRAVLVAAEVALSLTLLVGGALMVEGLQRLAGPELGIDPVGMHTTRISLPAERYPDVASRSAMHARILERVAAIPGVAGVALTSRLPLVGSTATVPVRAELRDVDAGREQDGKSLASLRVVSAGSFAVLRQRLVAGRDVGPGDDARAAPVAIVNEAFARQTWRDRHAIGRRITMLDAEGSERAYTVVGIAGDVKRSWVERDFAPMVYVADAQWGAATTILMVRGAAGAANPASAVRRALTALDPDMPVDPPVEFAQELAGRTSGVRMVATTMSLLGGFSLLLAAIGLYALVAFHVARRTPEFGVRMALGAQRGDILRLVFGEGVRLVGIGFAFGVPFAVAACWGMTAGLFGVVRPSAATLGGIVLMLWAVSAMALGIPAWRASRLDPADSLRRD